MLGRTTNSLARALARRHRAPAAACALALLASGAATLTAAPAAGAAVIPAFVQQASAHGSSKTSIAVTTGASVAAGDRLVVEVAVWNSKSATTSSVTDSLSDAFVEVTHFTASDATEMSIWTAPVASGGTAPTITARPTSSADMAIVAMEYSGLSTVPGITAVDQSSHAVGATTAKAVVQSVPTAPATASNELAVGFYADSGFGDTLSGGSGYTVRANVSPTSDIEMLAEDQAISAGATPAASVSAGASTIWLMATVVFASGSQSAPAPPSGVGASPGNNSANVSWTAPSSGGSQITSYTVTPYIGSAAQPTTVVTGTPPATTAVVAGL